jgi:hypothetical protein
MGQSTVITVGIIAGLILGTLSNYLYDLLKQLGIFPDRPTVKRLLIILVAALPFIFLVVLPQIDAGGEPVERINLSDADLMEDYNARFGFTYLYPKTWNRSYLPVNGDGTSYTDPKNENVEVRASGSLIVLPENRPDLICKSNEPDCTPSGRNVFLQKKDGTKQIYYKIDGVRRREEVVLSGKGYTVISITTIYKESVISISCQAPSDTYENYEDLCNRLVASLSIVEKEEEE